MDESDTTVAKRVVAIAALIALSLIHLPALGGWWLTDDPQILAHAVRETPQSVLFSPHAYRYLSTSSFTPLQTISFDFDHSIAGMDPRFYYVHQLLAIAAIAILLFLLVERWAGLVGGWIAAAMFLVSPQTAFAARSLMLRHYVEGLLFALVAVILWCPKPGSLRGPAWRRDLLSAVFYLLAMLAKEFYAPLPLLLLIVAVAEKISLRDLVRRLIPHATVAALYLAWRSAMLGSIGGYGGSTVGHGLGRLPAELWKAIVGVDRLLFWCAALAVLGALLVAAFARSARVTMAFIAFAALFLALPLIAVANDFQFRYAFTATAVLAVGAALSIDPARKWTMVAPGIFLAMLALTGIAEARRFPHETRQMVAEGEYVWSQPSNASPLLAYSPGWYLVGLEWLRGRELHQAAPLFVLSPDGVSLRGIAASTVVTSHPDEDAMRPLDAGAIGSLAREKAGFDASVPLSLEIERKGSDVRWALGPDGGSFTFFTIPYYDDFELPPAGWRRLPEPPEREKFRIRRALPDGRWSISPLLYLPRDGEIVRWKSAGM